MPESIIRIHEVYTRTRDSNINEESLEQIQNESFNNFRVLKYLMKLKQYHGIVTGLNNYPEVRCIYFPLLVFCLDIFQSNKVLVQKIKSLFGQLINSVYYDPIMNDLIGSFISEEEE